MAKAQITLLGITPKPSDPSTVIIKFTCKAKAGYRIRLSDSYGGPPRSDSGSVRLYYSVSEDVPVSKSCPFTTLEMSLTYNTVKTDDGGYKSEIEWTLPSGTTLTDNKIWFQLRLGIYRDLSGYNAIGTTQWAEDNHYKHYSTYKSPANPSMYVFKPFSINQPLFQVASYSNPRTITEDGETYDVYDKDWIDFTDCIALPSYDVNYEEVAEDWEDANYITHRIAVRNKIVGKFELWFSDRERYNKFFYLIKKNRELNGNGTAYVELQLQVNDDLGPLKGSSESDYANMPTAFEQGIFFLKIDSNPWSIPVYGHYDKYQAIGVSIQQA